MKPRTPVLSLTRPLASLTAPLTALLLAGCASFSPDGGMDRVDQLARLHAGQGVQAQRSAADAEAARARVAEWLAQPLQADGAVAIAFLNNRHLQAAFAALGVAEAERVAAGRWRGPTLGLSRLAGGGVTEIDRALVFDLLGLLTLPAAARAEQARFEQAQLQAAQETVALAAETRRAWFRAVAAQQLLGYALQVKDSADAATELARRMAQAGNFSTLQQLREQAFNADAAAQLARARHAAAAERERLLRLLGLGSDQAAQLRLPERLPDLPAALPTPQQAEQVDQAALERRLDVQIARRELQARAEAAGVADLARWLEGAQLGLQSQSQTGEATRKGVTIDLPVGALAPGAPGPRRAQAALAQAAHHAAAVQADAQSQLRQAWSGYRAAWAIAKQQAEEIVPLRQRIAQENLLRYNGMLIGTFELLADAREQVAAVTTAIETLREHWLAQTDLQAVIAGLPATN